MTSIITICETCKRSDWDIRAATQGLEEPDGVALAALVEAAAEGVEGVETRRHPCLMGCSHGCNVALQAPGKLSYTLGNFETTEEAAEGIVAYAALHAQSQSGQVPFKQWPQAIKGHFVTRIPPLPEETPVAPAQD